MNATRLLRFWRTISALPSEKIMKIINRTLSKAYTTGNSPERQERLRSIGNQLYDAYYYAAGREAGIREMQRVRS